MRVNNEIPLSEMVGVLPVSVFYAQTDRRSPSQYFQQHFVDVFGLERHLLQTTTLPDPS